MLEINDNMFVSCLIINIIICKDEREILQIIEICVGRILQMIFLNPKCFYFEFLASCRIYCNC
jgi:hypothetical protein